MDNIEIALARRYLEASGQDAITALIRSVKDLARMGRLVHLAQAGGSPQSGRGPAWQDSSVHMLAFAEASSNV